MDSFLLNWEPAVLRRPEANFTMVGQYYDAVVVSARAALLPEMLRETPGFAMSEIAVNWNHPNSQGHFYLAELVVRTDFFTHSFGQEEEGGALLSAVHIHFLASFRDYSRPKRGLRIGIWQAAPSHAIWVLEARLRHAFFLL